MIGIGSDPIPCGGLLYAVYYHQESFGILRANTNAFPHCAFHGIRESEVFQFAGNFGFEVCQFSDLWTSIPDPGKYLFTFIMITTVAAIHNLADEDPHIAGA